MPTSMAGGGVAAWNEGWLECSAVRRWEDERWGREGGREGGWEGGNREEEKVGGRDGYRWIERGRMEEERESHNK